MDGWMDGWVSTDGWTEGGKKGSNLNELTDGGHVDVAPSGRLQEREERHRREIQRRQDVEQQIRLLRQDRAQVEHHLQQQQQHQQPVQYLSNNTNSNNPQESTQIP